MSEQGFYSAFSEYLSSGNASEMEAFCSNPGHINRLAVYRNGYYKSAIDALMANYPTCVLLVGEQIFRKISRVYVEQMPIHQATLVGYGEHFSTFIFQQMNDRVAEVGLANLVAAVAELDRNWLQSLSSAEPAKLLTAELVQELSAQGRDITALQVSLSPSVNLCEVAFTVLQRWLELKAGSDTAGAERASDISVPAKNVPAKSNTVDVTAMFWRLQGVVQVRILSPAETALMRCLQQSATTLEVAFSAALAVDAVFDVSELFSAFLQNQLIDIRQP